MVEIRHYPATSQVSCTECGQEIPEGSRYFVRWRHTKTALVSDASEHLCSECAYAFEGQPKPQLAPVERRRHPIRTALVVALATGALVAFTAPGHQGSPNHAPQNGGQR